MNEVEWFGRRFTPYGVSADPKKIIIIQEKGRPSSSEDVWSLLMTCQYNAKFTFDNPTATESYEEITAPLRALPKQNCRFTWGEKQDEGYQKLTTIMNSTTTLRPYSKEKPTHFVADGSPLGIQATIYQEAKDRWVPIDHVSRALTPTEQKYAPIERESLAQSWGMTQFRYYLLGKQFTCWTDHQPLIPLYNNRQKTASLRISNHRDKIQDLSFKMQYLPGKEMPSDYGSRHPTPDHLSEEEQNRLGFDNGQEIIVRKIDITHSPDGLKTEGIKEAANRDVDYQYLINAITKGLKITNTQQRWDTTEFGRNYV